MEKNYYLKNFLRLSIKVTSFAKRILTELGLSVTRWFEKNFAQIAEKIRPIVKRLQKNLPKVNKNLPKNSPNSK